MSDDWPNGWYQNEKPSGGGGYGSGGPGGMANEPTRDMRAQVPGRASGAAPSAWPAQPSPRGGYGGGSDGGGGSYGSSRIYRTQPGWRRWVRPKRLLIMFGVLVVVLAALGAFFYTTINGKLNRANVLTDYSGRPTPTAGTNWLITGSDSRGGLTRAQEAQLSLGHDVAGQRSDTIMVLHIPANGNPPVLVSIPRDSYVEIPGYGMNKINAAFAIGGPKLLAETVQNVTGLYINHYLGIGLGGLVDAVNAVGGVRMCLPDPLKDPKAHLNLHKGCQNLNGPQVLGLVRTRNFPLGDLQREADQRLLLSALLKKMTSTGTMLNPFASIPAAYSVAGTLDVDSGVQLLDLYSVGQALKSPESTSVPFGYFENTNVGSVIRWDHAKATELFNDLATDKPVPKSLLSSTSLKGTALFSGEYTPTPRPPARQRFPP